MNDPRKDDEALRARVEASIQSSRLRPIACMMALTHRYAIEYIEQAPALVLLATRGKLGDARANAVLARSFRVATEGRKLRDALGYYGAPLPMRKLRGICLRLENHDALKHLRAVPPSTLAQIIPEKRKHQDQWLGALRLTIHMSRWLHYQTEDAFMAFFRWVAAASAVPARGGIRTPTIMRNIGDMVDLYSRARFDLSWTWDEANAAMQRWYEHLAAERNTADFVKSFGRGFTDEISYAPLPDDPTIMGDLTFTPLRSGEALFLEGQAMKHCVASYTRDVFIGRSRIYSIRRGADHERVATLELSPDGTSFKALQLRGVCNSRPDKNIERAAGMFLTHLNDGLKPKKEGVAAIARRIMQESGANA